MEGTNTSRFAATSKDDGNIMDEGSDGQIKMRIATGCLISYFLVGWIAYCFVFEEFTFTDATYFLMVTLTTVGYGDLTPTSQASRLFTLFFVLFGIAIVAVALVEIAEYIMKQRGALLKKTQADIIKKAGADEESVRVKTSNPFWERAKAFVHAHPIIGVTVNFGLYAVITGGIYAGIENWAFMDGVYFSIITGTTVGYGDISPTSVGGRWLSVLFLPFAVIFVSTQLSQLANILLGKSEDSKLKALLAVDLSLEALLNMDTDGDGEISEFEFLKFMLSSAGMADEDMLDTLHKRFLEMDADGSGSLTKEDILILIERQKRDNDQQIEPDLLSQ
mmetsp:Transcript_5041/g.6528  ORF Transcript_5041/g.6528 Transcript_5041/m.6528 type:complete len:334 (+) Transcript_5041:72-1073(+)